MGKFFKRCAKVVRKTGRQVRKIPERIVHHAQSHKHTVVGQILGAVLDAGVSASVTTPTSKAPGHAQSIQLNLNVADRSVLTIAEVEVGRQASIIELPSQRMEEQVAPPIFTGDLDPIGNGEESSAIPAIINSVEKEILNEIKDPSKSTVDKIGKAAKTLSELLTDDLVPEYEIHPDDPNGLKWLKVLANNNLKRMSSQNCDFDEQYGPGTAIVEGVLEKYYRHKIEEYNSVDSGTTIPEEPVKQLPEPIRQRVDLPESPGAIDPHLLIPANQQMIQDVRVSSLPKVKIIPGLHDITNEKPKENQLEVAKPEELPELKVAEPEELPELKVAEPEELPELKENQLEVAKSSVKVDETILAFRQFPLLQKLVTVSLEYYLGGLLGSAVVELPKAGYQIILRKRSIKIQLKETLSKITCDAFWTLVWSLIFHCLKVLTKPYPKVGAFCLYSVRALPFISCGTKLIKCYRDEKMTREEKIEKSFKTIAITTTLYLLNKNEPSKQDSTWGQLIWDRWLGEGINFLFG